MTYSMTVNSGVANFITPDGQRHTASDVITMSDREFGLLTAGAKADLTAVEGATSTGYLGGTVSHQVTLKSSVSNVVLPNGIRYPASAVAVLSDEEYSTIPAAARTALFSADTTTLT